MNLKGFTPKTWRVCAIVLALVLMVVGSVIPMPNWFSCILWGFAGGLFGFTLMSLLVK